MTTAQVVETSVTVTNSSFQNYTRPDDHTRQITYTPGLKPCTQIFSNDSIHWKVRDCKILYFITHLIAVSRFITVASKQKAKTKALFPEAQIGEKASAAKIFLTTTSTWEEKESIFEYFTSLSFISFRDVLIF